jgi:hypothetical protein
MIFDSDSDWRAQVPAFVSAMAGTLVTLALTTATLI